MNKTSEQSDFHKLSAKERIEIIKDFRRLTDDDVKLLYSDFSSPEELEEYANRWGENVIGKFAYFPLRIAPNFLIDGKDYFVPMAIEEPSVVAAASYAANLARKGGGFKTDYTGSIMRGQIQIIDVKNPYEAMKKILDSKDKLLELANKQDQKLVSVGGGAKDIEIRAIELKNMIIADLFVDVKDVMGANAVNTMAEAISPEVEEITGYKTNLRIISNLADRRLAKSKCKIPIKELSREGFSGEEVAERIISAYEFADNDIYRAATHNKGIMNGIDACLLDTGQDFRAVEAGAHVYACKDGRYKPLTKYKIEDDFVVGEIELPMAVGVYGGVRDQKPELAKNILGVKTSDEFARVLASVGLAQNFGALRALATEGIQKGHMRLHAKQIVKQINAGEYESKVLEELIKGPITFDRATKIFGRILKELNISKINYTLIIMIRQPIIVTVGHSDAGKTTLLDKIRGTAVTAKEPGFLTQNIGASYIPINTIKEICGNLLEKFKIKIEIPGLLFIDTPGHAAFITIRKRGSSIADLAILVVDITEGVQEQTDESIKILKHFKTPFLIAATKIDKIEGWIPQKLLYL